MNSIVSILHISDLHRSLKEQISNAALLSSLISDKERYTSEEARLIKTPDLVVVSGDIIRGSTSSTNSKDEINKQYKEAEGLLISLCDEFLSGDRSRMIIIPGNHDMDWKYSRDSMIQMDKKNVYKDRFVRPFIHEEMVKSSSTIRFSWKDFSCYEIYLPDIYEKRVEAFATFYDLFYQGIHTYPLDQERQFHIHDFEQFNITFVAFNSCFGNDHLRLAGDIHPECIANSNTELLKYKRKGRMILATWHHNTKGDVYDMNFMDSNKLKNFIDAGISVGLHGHQHQTDLIYEYSNALEQKKITVFSAGTLCGGRSELPTGTTRQYNLIEIDRSKADKVEVTLHVREKTVGSSFQNPVWQPGRIPDTLESYITVKVDKPKEPPLGVSLDQVDKMIHEKRFDNARSILQRLDIKTESVRYQWAQLIEKSDNAELAFQMLLPPQNKTECIMLLGFALNYGNGVTKKRCLDVGKQFTPADPSINHLIKQLEALIQ